MKKGLLELVKILSMLVAIGAVVWLGFSVIASAKEFGGTGEVSGPLRSSGIVFLVAVVINIIAGRVEKRAA